MSTTFEFQPDEDGTLKVESAVFQALGAASMCWSETPQGVFESDRAKEIGEALLIEIDRIEAPRLGYATTRELIDELIARIKVDYASGGGGLGYTTVRGRPESLLEQIAATANRSLAAEEQVDGN